MSGKIREKSGNFEVDDKWQPRMTLEFLFALWMMKTTDGDLNAARNLH